MININNIFFSGVLTPLSSEPSITRESTGPSCLSIKEVVQRFFAFMNASSWSPSAPHCGFVGKTLVGAFCFSVSILCLQLLQHRNKRSQPKTLNLKNKGKWELEAQLKKYQYSRELTLSLEGYLSSELPPLPKNIISLKLSEASALHSIEGLPSSIDSLQIENCQGLQSLNIDELSHLKNLELRDLPLNELNLRYAVCLAALRVTRCQQLNELKNLPSSIDSLQIQDCQGLQSLNIDELSNLKILKLYDLAISELIFLRANFFETAKIGESEHSSKLVNIAKIPPVHILEIRGCEQLIKIENLPTHKLFKLSLYDNEYDYWKLFKQYGASTFPALSSLEIANCHPRGDSSLDLQALSKLNLLTIRNCEEASDKVKWPASLKALTLIAGKSGEVRIPSHKNFISSKLSIIKLEGVQELSQQNNLLSIGEIKTLLDKDCKDSVIADIGRLFKARERNLLCGKVATASDLPASQVGFLPAN